MRSPFEMWNQTFPHLARQPLVRGRYAYDFRCRACGTEESRVALDNPGTILCSGCRSTEPVRWWRTRPEVPFDRPDTTGIEFGPTLAELLDTGRPHARIRDDVDGMTVAGVKLKEPEAPPHAAEQGDLFKRGE